jgi:hypothetical protein
MALYIEPLVIPELPGGSSALDFVRELDKGPTSPLESDVRVSSIRSVTPALLLETARGFIVDKGRILVVLGDAGTGKSMFMRTLAREYESAMKRIVDSVFVVKPGEVVDAVLLPILISLKARSVGSLRGLVRSVLLELYQWTEDMCTAFAAQDTTCPVARLLVLCDGFDELERGELSCVNDFQAQVCDGIPLPLVSLIVTSRESRIDGRTGEARLFGSGTEHTYERRVVLPFSKAKVRAVFCVVSCPCPCFYDASPRLVVLAADQ